jgi:hypothetical protein
LQGRDRLHCLQEKKLNTVLWKISFCGEGACSRSAAQQSQEIGPAAQASGSKLPRHSKDTCDYG